VYSDGSEERFDPASGRTTFTDASGAVYKTREQADGTVVSSDAGGGVTEFNPKTKVTTHVEGDGGEQGTTRLVDGSTRTVLEDGTEIVTAPNGAQTITHPDGTATSVAITTNGKMVESKDGSMARVSTGDGGEMQVAYDYVEGAGGIESLVANPEDGTIDVVMGNGEELAVTIGNDGSMTVESDKGTRTFNSAGAVLGAVSTSKAPDGSTEIASESGATSKITTDGLIMTVESADGTSAVSTKTSTGVTVEVDGVTYAYDFTTKGATFDNDEVE